MKKRWLFTLLGTMSMLIIMALARKNKGTIFAEYFPLKSAGQPDQTERMDDTQLENSKMVSEGSQYGVQYYNELAEEDH